MPLRNLKAVAPADPAEALKVLFENPEITAMAEICQILQGLDDDAARLRVMRWSFARFGGEEFKRPLASTPPPLAQSEPELSVDEMLGADSEPRAAAEDFAGQVSELKDLFPRPAAVGLTRLRPPQSNSRA